MQISLSRLKLTRLPDILGHLGRWWLKEFLSLFPERMVELLSGRGRTLVVVSADQGGATFELVNSAHALMASERTTHSDNVLTEIDGFLHARGVERKDADIGLRLPAESVFVRQLLLPAEARGAIDAIVAQDLANKTPFKVGDIYYDHVASEGGAGERIQVWQWVARRQFVQQALLPLKMNIEDLAFIVADSRDRRMPAPFISLRRGAYASSSWSRKIAPILCCSALILALIASGLKYWNQQATLDRLDADIAATSSKAQQVRALVDQLKEKRSALLRLRIQRSESPGLIDLWEETTRMLPSNSWLIEFRLAEVTGKREEQVTMAGFSNAAPSLVGIIDSSRLFFDTALTSPVTFDATEGRERFALQTKVRLPEMLKEAAR
jgi:general secretion pathway protein L